MLRKHGKSDDVILVEFERMRKEFDETWANLLDHYNTKVASVSISKGFLLWELYRKLPITY